MPRQDFYITFGSDIEAFNAGLVKELSRTEKIVSQFEQRINKIGSGATNSPLGKLLKQIEASQKVLHDQAGTGSAKAAGTAASPDAGDIRKAMQSFTSELRKLVTLIRTETKGAAPSARNATTERVPSAANIPRADIEDAAVARMVEAADRNAAATRRVENAINRLINRLVGRVPAQPGGAAKEGVAAANSETGQQKRRTTTGGFASAESQSAYFAELARVRPELAGIVNMEDKLAAAVRLVTQEQATQREAVDLLGASFGRTRKEAEKALSAAMASQRVGGRTGQLAAAAEQRAQEEARAAAGGGANPVLGPAAPNATQWAAMARAERQATQESVRASQATRDQTLVQDAAERVLARTSIAARGAAAALRALVTAGASDVQIARAQADVYAQLNRELSGMASPQRRAAIGSVLANSGTPVTGPQLTRLAGTAGVGAASTEGGRVGDAMGTAARDRFSAIFGNTGFYGSIVHKVGTFLTRNFAAGLVFGLTNALQQAIDQGVQTESTFVRVSQALEQTGRSSAGLRTDLQGLSEQYGVSLKSVYETTAGLTGLFDQGDTGNKQLLALTKVAVQLELISGGALSATEAMRSLSSVTSAYGQDAPEHMADVLTTIQNRLSVNIEESIEGVARLSGEAKLMGIDFEHAAVYAASIAKFTGQSGAGAGEQLSRMLESLQKGPTQKVIIQALKTQNVDVRGAFAVRDYQGAIDALMSSYGRLNKAQQAQVAIAIGGARQAAATSAWLIQGTKSLDTINAAYHSNGIAQERARQISQQLTAQMSRARQAFVNFFAVLIRTGVLNAFGIALVTVRTALDDVNHVLSLMNDLLDKSPLTRLLRSWVLALAGLALGFKLAMSAARGLAIAMNASVFGRALTGRKIAAGEAGAAEGEAAAGGGAAAAGEVGLLASIFGRRGTPRVNPRLNPELYLPRAAETEGQLALFGTPREFGPTDVNGVPLSATQRLYARSSVRAQNLGTSLSQRANRLGESAEARLAPEAEAGLRSKLLARSMQGAALGMQGMAAASNGMSNVMAGMARNFAKVNLAIAGLGAIALALYSSYQYNKEMNDKLSAAFNAAFGEAKKKPGSPTHAQTAEGYFAQWLAENSKARNPSFVKTLVSPSIWGRSVGTIGKSLFQGIGDTFTSSPGALFTNIGHRLTGNVSANSGVTTSDQDTKYFEKPLHDLFGRVDKRLLGHINSVKDVDKVIKANEKEITNTANSINKSGASQAQKATLLRDLANMQQQLHEVQDSYRLAALGMASLDTLTQDQLDAIGPMVQSIVGFGTQTSRTFAPLIAAYLEQFGGFLKGSTYQKSFSELLRGTTTENKYGGAWHEVNPDYVGSGYAPGGSIYREQVPLQGQAPVRTRQMNQEDRQAVGIRALRTAALAAQAQVQGMSESEQKTDEGQKFIQSAFNLIGTYYQAVSQRLQQVTASAQAIADLDRSRGNYTGAASQAKSVIQDTIRQMRHDGATQAQIDVQVAQLQDQAAQDRVTAATNQYEIAKSQTRNSIAAAGLELQAAQAAQRELQNGGTAAEKQQAAIRVNQANLAVQDQNSEFALAALQTQLDQNTAPGDEMAQARAKLQYARAVQADAANRFTTNSAQYEQATQGVIAAQRDVTKAVSDVAEANSQLAIAYAVAAGHPVQAAKLALEDAKRKLRVALKNAGGNRNAPEVRQAQSDVVTTQAALRDAKLQDSLDTINFNQQMGYITSQSAIHELQQLLKQRNLTREQRRSILLQIHGLQQDLVSSLTSSGFNIPGFGDLKLPTPYEVRRSLGVDKMQKALKDAVDIPGGGFSLTTMTNATARASNTRSSTDLISAVKSVQTAIENRGAQKVSVTQQNHFNTPSRQVAREIAQQVIEILNRQMGAQVRASTTTPRHVTTR